MPADPVPERIDCDAGGIDDLWIPSHDIRLERMDDGHYWMRVGPHVFHFYTRRNALIRTNYCNEKTGAEHGFERS